MSAIAKEDFSFEIIRPEKIIYSDTSKMTTLPSYEGDLSILVNHISIITFLRPGIVKVQKNDESFENFFVQDGIVEYFSGTLVVLSASVINVKDLSKEFLEDINKETLNKLSNKDITDHDRYMLNYKLDAIKEIRI